LERRETEDGKHSFERLREFDAKSLITVLFSFCHEGLSMVRNQQRRNGLMIAYLAIACALVLATAVPQASRDAAAQRTVLLSDLSACYASSAALHTGPSASDLAAILPFLAVGFVSLLALSAGLVNPYVSRTPQARALAQAFERPPPTR
jgi:hypothetical protein